MVRETRHLWVGNLPDNIREDRIREHFKRYGRVQNVKLLGRTESGSTVANANGATNSGVCATVAFMDIKSASKAHNAEHVLDERTLTTEYYEPAAIPSAAGAPSAGSSPAGSGYSGSSSSVNSTPAPSSVSRYHLSGGEESTGSACPIAATAAAPANWRGTNDSASEYCRRGNTPAAYSRYRNNANAPYSTPPSNVERTTPHHRWYAGGDRGSGGGSGGGTGGGGAGGGATGGESTPSTPGGGTESGRRRRPSGSGSSRSESSSPEPSDTSRASTPQAPPPPLAHHANHRAPSTPSHHHQWSSTASGRPLAICVRNLPTRSTDSSLKDGLYHEYKKHGKVVWVKVVGQNADRYAVVRFKKPSDVEKALEVSQDKLFFGCKISVAPHQSCDEDADSAKPYETDIDEYHPKATRTLFIGNLEKDVTQQQLRDKFKHFGRIIEIDIKKGSGGGAGYAFCQYASISSVVEAIRAMDGEYVGGSRVKLGFGKPVATTCVWVDGLTEHTEKQVLGAISRCGAATSVCVDRAAGAALVHFEQAAAAGAAVRELRRVAASACQAAAAPSDSDLPRLTVDYASRECQEAFYEQLEKHGGAAALSGLDRITGEISSSRYLSTARHDALRYDGCGSRARASSYGRGSSRTPRYPTLDHYDSTEYTAERRYRVYDELGSSPQTEDTPFEDRLQSVVVSPHRARRHRRDSSPEDRKHSKERHRSVGGSTVVSCVGTARRSRSGSRGGERHGGRRRHRRRRDGSGSRGSRAGTPLRDEPDAPPAEPRRPPRERPPLPMSLPLPKFAVQLLRQVPPTPRPTPAPAPAPDSPPRPPSVSSSSGGSAPHSPSLEERIRSLDEKYEKWSGSRALADAPDRTRLRHRLLEVDINEVKPSEVVRSLLAKRSVFDEDSERLEGAVRAPSPASSPRARPAPPTPRVLRCYPFPTHNAHQPLTPTTPSHVLQMDADIDLSDRPADPRLNRSDRSMLTSMERVKFGDNDPRFESRVRPRTPSTDRSQLDSNDRRSPRPDVDSEVDPRGIVERRRRNSSYGANRSCADAGIDTELSSVSDTTDLEHRSREKRNSLSSERRQSVGKIQDSAEKKLSEPIDKKDIVKLNDDNNSSVATNVCLNEDNKPRESGEMLLKRIGSFQDIKPESFVERRSKSIDEYNIKSELPAHIHEEIKSTLENETKFEDFNCQIKSESERPRDIFTQNHVKKEFLEIETQHNHLNSHNLVKKDIPELSQDFIKNCEKNGKERYNQNIMLEALHITKLEKENIEFEKCFEKDKFSNAIFFGEKKMLESEKISEDRVKNDKSRHGKDRHDKEKQEKHETEKERAKSTRHEKMQDKIEKEKRPKDDNNGEKVHLEKSEKHKDSEKSHKDKSDRDTEKTKHSEEKSSRHDHHRKEKSDKEKRKDSADSDIKVKKDDKSKHEKSRKDSSDSKREHKKDSDSSKVRKSSRDESSRDIYRKDSTDSSTSRASHDSSKLKELDVNDIKEEPKSKKNYNDIICKSEIDKEVTSKCMDIIKFEPIVKVKTEPKEGKDQVEHYVRTKNENAIDHTVRSKSDITEKQRHYSLDSPNVDSKRKERLNSCSSLPSNIGHKRRMSSQDSLDCLNEDLKKSKNEGKYPDRRDSKDSRNVERHKTTKFNKCHFAKIIESKTKDDKKNQVKPPDDSFEFKESEHKEEMVCPERLKTLKKSPAVDVDEKICPDVQSEGLQNDIDFLATLELRSSEEDEKQKALRKEMKEKKRIQQLQQIQELQMQQDAMQQAELMNKLKDDKKKTDEKKKEAARDKRMSTDRKSRDDKNDSSKPRKNRKAGPSTTDTSDSDEPKKHSIFDIIDDGPTYISMYDKVKARSCKNMQKQEEEKRQEKIKAKFSQLKQSRAKREEKKRSSWDEDSDSDHERKRANKSSMDSSTDDENMVIHNKKREKIHASSSLDYEHNKTNDYFSAPSNEEDSRNKLSRKNSRTRIMSDTSDDEASKRSISKSPNFTSEVKKDVTSDSEPLHRSKDDSVHSKDTSEDKIKKNSLLNLFGKSDSDDSKIKSGLETDIEYKPNFTKSIPNDFSSESESALSNRNMGEMRKKHKKKQKKHKSSSVSDSENKFDNEGIGQEGETKHKISEKVRRHSTKKEKRKDKIRESIDTDEPREEKNKIKRDKKLTNTNFDTLSENLSKKDGKMEDIFGPLSDESDRETRNKVNNTSHSYITSFGPSNEQSGVMVNCEDGKFKDKDDNKRKRDKKRKDKRFLFKEDDNSLDVDAVSKAIEARLFAESITDDDNRAGLDELPEYIKKIEQSELKHISESLIVENKVNERHIDKMKKDCREKKKKKKRNREDRQSRKDHHHLYHHDKIDKSDVLTESVIDISSKDMLLDIPLPSGTPTPTITDKSDDNKSLCESPSLPRLIDSPPIIIQGNSESEQKQSELECTTPPSKDTSMEIDYPETNQVEVDDIPMPPPIENIDISEVPLPEDPPIEPPIKRDNSFVPNFNDDIDKSESAVRSISNLNENDKQVEKADVVSCKVEKKAEEKPRAIISQEETEDAVAALLGESFGGKVNSFADCYEPVENNPIIQTEIETTSIETENIPEEDAEEMRQAVQNLNASEMEIKPDTPVSDNDLLLIDTDTEEADETPQDAIERLPVNIIATNQSLANVTVEQPKSTEVPSIVIAKPKTTIVQVVTSNATGTSAASAKVSEPDVKIQLAKRETGQQITSTATPVITSWISSLSSNKIVEPHVLNIQPNALPNRDKSESKPTHITANIVQIKAAQGQNVHLNNTLRPIITPNRVGAPYQVINQMIRPQTPNMQPPTIKIPEPHIIYQKPSGIVISPRMTNDPRMQSPKTPSQGEGMTSPRLSNMTILSTSPQNINSVGIASPNTLQQRSPGQVTVVRMQQPPLSPIQAMHIPHGARTMVSPNRPNSVLVQTQGTPIHFNRLPVTPVLAPISKQISINNVVQQNKGINVSTSTLIHQQKIINEEKRKADQRAGTENVNDNAKILLSPTSLPQSTNPTVMAQNRLITMQHAVHVGNMNSALHLGNKVLLNNLNQLNDKRDNQIQKSEQLNHLPFGTTPIIHVTGVNPSTASIIQSVSKPVMCTLQEANTISRTHGSNVIHTMNSQRLLTTAPMSNVIQIDANKGSPSVLSMATIRPPTVLTKLESTKSIAATTTCLANVVMTPLLLKTTNASGAIILNPKADQGDNHGSTNIPLANHISRENEIKLEVKEESTKIPPFVYDSVDKSKESYKPNMSNSVETIAKCETDFEELLKDNTNEIKVTNDPEKKLEVNVGKTVTLITPQNRERKQSIDGGRKDEAEKNKPIPVSEQSSIEGILPSKSEEKVPNTQVDKENKESSVIENSMVINSANIENKLNPEIPIKEVPIKDIPVITPTVITNNTKSEPEKSPEFGETSKPTEDKFFSLISKNIENSDNHIKNLDENDSWSDVNIESVIKKVDSLCNENMDVPDNKEEKIPPEITEKTTNSLDTITNNTIETLPNDDDNKPMDVQIETTVETTVSDNTSSPGKPSLPGKRGGRSVRGKKSDKNSDRVQTRQISKPARGGTSARRGRGGRAKVDKKIKNMVNSNTNNIPGDVYDFHEDSGDEDTSPNRTETRPRLILTIKSPLSGHCATPTSTLSITPKDQPKVGEKITKDEKPEDFLSPSLNTRKSRRLQEKDVQKSNTDEALDDFVRSPATPAKTGKRKPGRQTGVKAGQADTRKSPRGVKRTRDRSLSDTSIDSGDEKVLRTPTEPTREAKTPRLAEPTVPAKPEPETPPPAPKPAPPPTVVQQPTPAPMPTPIMKPPKKMISEISAKLAGAFETATVRGPITVQQTPPTQFLHQQPERPQESPAEKSVMIREPAQAAPAVADAEFRAEPLGEAYARRLVDNVPGNMVPVGATEATDARVQSPALPHRPPSTHRPADRATPVLIRGGESEGAMGPGGGVGVGGAAGPGLGHVNIGLGSGVGVGVGAGVGVGVGAGAGVGVGAGGSRFRGAYAGPASLPRGAHHPPHPQHAPHPQLPHLPPHSPHPPHTQHPQHPHVPVGHAAHIKQVAVVGPHHHTHPAAASRVTLTSVPSISPQGQIGMGDNMYPHFSHQHYQVYQQHFRATQHESRATPSPYTRSLEAEGCEAPTPPLELRRPPSARVPRPAHSPAPADRLIMYAVGCGRSPPPAHGTSRLPGALPPSTAPGPPHASQVPREADSLQMLLRRYPVMWQGLLALKNDSAAVQMHFVGGNPGVAGDTLPRHADGSTPLLRIAQRMRLEPAQLDQVHRKMKLESEHCMLLALPCGRDHMDVLQQSTNLTAGFITYLQRKQAAGIVNVAPPGHQQALFTVHIFPSCDFANENLNRIAPDLMHRVADIAHLLIVIATV